MFKYFIQLPLRDSFESEEEDKDKDKDKEGEDVFVNILRWELLCKPTITLAPRFNIFLGCSPFCNVYF